jgi:hypothetical protein
MGGLTNAAQGVPLLGNFVPRTEAARDYERTYPHASTIGQLLVGTAPYALAARGVQRGVAGLQNMLNVGGRSNRIYPGLFSDTVSQGLLGGGTSLADRELATYLDLAGPSNSTERIIRGLSGGILGSFGPLSGRVFAPSGPGRTLRLDSRGMPTDPKAAREIMFELGPSRVAEIYRNLSPGLTGRARDREFAELLNYQRRVMAGRTTSRAYNRYMPAAVGALTGHLISGGSLPGMMAGGLLGQIGYNAARTLARTRGGRRWLSTRMHPNLQAELNALGPTAGIQFTRPEDRIDFDNVPPPNNTLR